MDRYLSDKIKAISFFSIIMVVYLHSYNLVIKLNSEIEIIDKGFNSFIQDFISNGLTRIAVPFFFCISGYLFFANIHNIFLSVFLIKFKKRFFSLVIPYLLWSIFGILFYYILQTIPISKPFFSKELIRNYTTSEFLNVIFLNPIPYQLWFVRDLIVSLIFSILTF